MFPFSQRRAAWGFASCICAVSFSMSHSFRCRSCMIPLSFFFLLFFPLRVVFLCCFACRWGDPCTKLARIWYSKCFFEFNTRIRREWTILERPLSSWGCWMWRIFFFADPWQCVSFDMHVVPQYTDAGHCNSEVYLRYLISLWLVMPSTWGQYGVTYIPSSPPPRLVDTTVCGGTRSPETPEYESNGIECFPLGLPHNP